MGAAGRPDVEASLGATGGDRPRADNHPTSLPGILIHKGGGTGTSDTLPTGSDPPDDDDGSFRIQRCLVCDRCPAYAGLSWIRFPKPRMKLNIMSMASPITISAVAASHTRIFG